MKKRKRNADNEIYDRICMELNRDMTNVVERIIFEIMQCKILFGANTVTANGSLTHTQKGISISKIILAHTMVMIAHIENNTHENNMPHIKIAHNNITYACKYCFSHNLVLFAVQYLVHGGIAFSTCGA